MQKLYKERPRFCDIAIKCVDETLYAHRAVLAARTQCAAAPRPAVARTCSLFGARNMAHVQERTQCVLPMCAAGERGDTSVRRAARLSARLFRFSPRAARLRAGGDVAAAGVIGACLHLACVPARSPPLRRLLVCL